MANRPMRAAKVQDVHALAMAMPHVTVEVGSRGNPVYQVGGKSFVFFRTPPVPMRPTPPPASAIQT